MLLIVYSDLCYLLCNSPLISASVTPLQTRSRLTYLLCDKQLQRSTIGWQV